MSSTIESDLYSSDDDDDYFERLQQEADRIEDEKNDLCGRQTPETRHFLDDETYYEAVQAENTQHEHILPEESVVWQVMCKSMISTNCSYGLIEVCREHASSIMSIRQWLFASLPTSSNLYCILKSFEVEDVIARRKIYVDDIAHPTLSIAMRNKVSMIEVEYYTCHSNNNAATLDCCELLVKLFNERFHHLLPYEMPNNVIEFEAINMLDLDPISACMATLNMEKRFVVACVKLVYEGSINIGADDLATGDLPTGYEYCKLSGSDAVQINSAWPYRSDGSMEMIEEMIGKFPSLGIRQTSLVDGSSSSSSSSSTRAGASTELVSWCLTYDNGGIGMLHTESSHRGRGLGRCVLRGLLSLWLRYGWGCYPYAFATVTNEVSQRLFLSLGFSKQGDCCWAGFGPRCGLTPAEKCGGGVGQHEGDHETVDLLPKDTKAQSASPSPQPPSQSLHVGTVDDHGCIEASMTGGASTNISVGNRDGGPS